MQKFSEPKKLDFFGVVAEKSILWKKAGVYLLSKSIGNNVTKWYVGRSDKDIYRRLLDHKDEKKKEKKYDRYQYIILNNEYEAFCAECEMYHRMKKNCAEDPMNELANCKHPDRPVYEDWKCPACEKFN